MPSRSRRGYAHSHCRLLVRPGWRAAGDAFARALRRARRSRRRPCPREGVIAAVRCRREARARMVAALSVGRAECARRRRPAQQPDACGDGQKPGRRARTTARADRHRPCCRPSTLAARRPRDVRSAMPELGPNTVLYNFFVGQIQAHYTFDLFGAARLANAALAARVNVQAYQFDAARRALAANIVTARDHVRRVARADRYNRAARRRSPTTARATRNGATSSARSRMRTR